MTMIESLRRQRDELREKVIFVITEIGVSNLKKKGV